MEMPIMPFGTDICIDMAEPHSESTSSRRERHTVVSLAPSTVAATTLSNTRIARSGHRSKAKPIVNISIIAIAVQDVAAIPPRAGGRASPTG